MLSKFYKYIKYEKTEYNDKIVNKFINLFLALTERIRKQVTLNTKKYVWKEFVILYLNLETLYIILVNFRRTFLKNTFEIIPNTIKIRSNSLSTCIISRRMCYRTFLKLQEILVTENLLFSVFNQKCRIDRGNFKLIGKTLYLDPSKKQHRFLLL